ncbi:transglutaminase-like putative cysteine protease [Sporosarcina luteola]|nr:transglutaminase-like putative cysteine protease [Sporosarcina luteola]
MKKYIVYLTLVLLSFLLVLGNPHADAKQTSSSYSMIRDALLNAQTTAHFDTSEVSYKDVGNIIHEVLRENPAILYYQDAKIWSDGNIQFTYSVPVATVKDHQKQLHTKVKSVLKSVNKPRSSDFEKVKAIHDYLVHNVAYDGQNYKRKTVPASSYSAYGSLINGIAVCDGYTKAAQLLMNQLGIENHYVSGFANGEEHSWNLVKLDGNYYHLDITWDDPLPDRKGTMRYTYFLVTADYLKKDHSWEEKNWPRATSNKYAFFHDFSNTVETAKHYYYSSDADHNALYRIAKDGKGKKKISNVRAPYFDISGDWIYFSNYSQNGHLYKMKLDGSSIKKLNNTHSVDLWIDGKTLHYTNEKTSKLLKLPI